MIRPKARRRVIRKLSVMLRSLTPENLRYVYRIVLFLLRKQGKDGAKK